MADVEIRNTPLVVGAFLLAVVVLIFAWMFNLLMGAVDAAARTLNIYGVTAGIQPWVPLLVIVALSALAVVIFGAAYSTVVGEEEEA